jgi:hypothetical protein
MRTPNAERQHNFRDGLSTLLKDVHSATVPRRYNPTVIRSLTAAGVARALDNERTPAQVGEQTWGRNLGMFTRAATTQDTLVTDAPLLTTAVADFVSMSPTCAFGQVASRCLQLNMSSSQFFFVPNDTAAASGASFISEGGVIPVRQQSITGTVLQPKKFAGIYAFTRELFTGSIPAAEKIVTATMEKNYLAKLSLTQPVLTTRALLASEVASPLQ